MIPDERMDWIVDCRVAAFPCMILQSVSNFGGRNNQRIPKQPCLVASYGFDWGQVWRARCPAAVWLEGNMWLRRLN